MVVPSLDDHAILQLIHGKPGSAALLKLRALDWVADVISDFSPSMGENRRGGEER
jgi:hypothetical protein